MEIIRKELSASEISSPAERYNAENDSVQYSPDAGTTWTDTPALDPRTAVQFRVPALVSDDPRCDAAANMTEYLRSMVNVDLLAATNWSLAGSLLSILLLVIPGGVFVDLLLIIAGVVLTLGAEAINAAFTSEVYDALLCVFYCNIDEDGQMSSAQLEAIIAAVEEQFDEVVSTVFIVHNRTLLENGWSNAGALGVQTGDCSACECATEWCALWDFTTSSDAEPWSLVGTGGHFSGTAYFDAACGIANNGDEDTSGCNIDCPPTVGAVAAIAELTFTLPEGATLDQITWFSDWQSVGGGYGGTLWVDDDCYVMEHVTELTLETPLTAGEHTIQIAAWSGDADSYSEWLYGIQLSGTGDAPTGFDAFPCDHAPVSCH